MKRDMDLVRMILFACEDSEHGNAPWPLTLEGYTDEEIRHHVYLMIQAGLMTGVENTVRGSNSPTARPTGLTWAGHDFLEASRNETIWAKAKQAAGTAGGMTIEVLKAVLIGLATDAAKKAAGLA